MDSMLTLKDAGASGGGSTTHNPGLRRAVQGVTGKHRAITPHHGKLYDRGHAGRSTKWLPGWRRAQGAQEGAVGQPLLPWKPAPAG